MAKATSRLGPHRHYIMGQTSNVVGSVSLRNASPTLYTLWGLVAETEGLGRCLGTEAANTAPQEPKRGAIQYITHTEKVDLRRTALASLRRLAHARAAGAADFRHGAHTQRHGIAAGVARTLWQHVFQARSRSRTSCRPTLSHLHAPSLRCWCGSLAAKFTSLTRYLALVSASQSSALAMKTKPSIPPTDWCTGWARRAPRRRLLGSGRGIQRSGGSSTIQRSAYAYESWSN